MLLFSCHLFRDFCKVIETRSVAAWFGQHGMPPPASNDTGTALGQDGSDWSRDVATLTFDLGGYGACGWCGSSSSICIPSLKFIGFAVRKIWHTMCVSINGPGDLALRPWNWCASRISGGEPSFWIWARGGRTDGQTKPTLTAPFPMGGGIISQINIASNIRYKKGR